MIAFVMRVATNMSCENNNNTNHSNLKENQPTQEYKILIQGKKVESKPSYFNYFLAWSVLLNLSNTAVCPFMLFNAASTSDGVKMANMESRATSAISPSQCQPGIKDKAAFNNAQEALPC